jgi:hypothetical protein
MSIQHVERRVHQGPVAAGTQHLAHVIRQGLLIRHSAGTVGASGSLKSNAVGSSIIQRVLSGSALRVDDNQALERQPAAFDAREREHLFGPGCGLVDLPLLASTTTTTGTRAWTLHRRVADRRSSSRLSDSKLHTYQQGID